MSMSPSRVTEFYESRQGWPVIFVVIALLIDGLGMFLAAEVAGDWPTLSNPLVWFGVVHAAICLCLAVSLLSSRWQWRVEQQGLVVLVSGVGFGYLFLSSYLSLMLYSSASWLVRSIMLLALVLYHGLWAWRVVTWYGTAWVDENLRASIYRECDDHIFYTRLGEVGIRDKLGVKFFPSNVTMVGGLLVSLGSYFFRHELTEYFGAQWVPIAFAIGGFTMSILATTLVTMSVLLYFVYPRILKRQTGKSVFIDLLSPSPSVPSH